MIKLYLAECNKQSEHTVGSALARFALYDTYSLNAALKKDAHGKPYFENCFVHISISHSGELCLAALSDGEIGADIERADTDGKCLVRLAKRYFTEDEAEYVCAEPNERFYHIWCAKESYIKYTGEGFSRVLKSFSVLETDMCFSHFDTDGYHICVCSRERTDAPPIFVEPTSLQF